MSLYTDIQTEPKLKFIHERLRDLRRHSSGFEDQNFETELHVDFQSRVWELMVSRILLEGGRSTRGSGGHGPDFEVRFRDLKVWIEATAPDRGDGSDRVPEFDYSSTDMRLVPVDQVVLRLTGAICAKVRQRQRHIADGVIQVHEPYVIALSGSKINEVGGLSPSGGMRSTLGWSDPVVSFGRTSPGGEDVRLQWKRSIQKRSGAEVSVSPFLSDEFSGISAVLWSPASILSLGYDLNRESQLIHNPLALNPLPVGLIPKAEEYWSVLSSDRSSFTTYRVSEKD